MTLTENCSSRLAGRCFCFDSPVKFGLSFRLFGSV